jgi:hypothetical protein
LTDARDCVPFGVGGRLLFVTCHEHAQVVRDGAALAGRVALTGLASFARQKLPTLMGVFDHVQSQRRRVAG